MNLLTIFYWVLLLMIVIGLFGAVSWSQWPRASSIIEILLFIIIGLKLLKPNW